MEEPQDCRIREVLLTNHRRMTKEQAGQLYDEYGGRLYRLSLMILWDSESAEDAVHQVFAKLLTFSEFANTNTRLPMAAS